MSSACSPDGSHEDLNIVILGTGIIGLSTAYYLSLLSPSPSKSAHHNTTIHLVDNSPTLFSSASGQAAGFLARDWFAPALSSLGALSFDLHRQLADEHDGGREWGYRPSVALSIADWHAPKGAERGEDWLMEGSTRAAVAGGESTGEMGKTKGKDLPAWLAVGREEVEADVQPISDGSTTAQVYVPPFIVSSL